MRAAVLHAAKDIRIEEMDVAALGPSEIGVRIGAGGICGSDLHYYFHGGFGTVRLREPMILGHEIAGTVAEIGSAVTSVKPGDRVAITPSRPCKQCKYCLAGQPNHCLDMRFYGSAMRMPHIQGAFRELLVCEAEQAFLVPDGISMNAAAFAEPLSVGLHAVRRAGPMLGRRVLVTGSGPIGALALMAARHAGAAEIVATDILDAPLKKALEVGADRTINVAETPEALAGYGSDKGYFDVMLEASGNGRAIAAGLDVVRPGGVVVQLGLGGDASLPLNTIVAKELELRGSFRFHEEFAWAVKFISDGSIDVGPLLSAVVPLADASRAFELAMDRTRSMKVQLAFD
jgi:L-idonate 5-dehydrogenase